MRVGTPIFTKLVLDQWHCMETCNAEFCSKRTKNVENTDSISLAPASNVWLLLWQIFVKIVIAGLRYVTIFCAKLRIQIGKEMWKLRLRLYDVYSRDFFMDFV
jgi:hypothetical protein